MPEPATLFILGLTYGLTVCTFTCLPYLVPYLIGTGTGFKNGLANSICFMSGKLITYATLGGVAAFVGHSLDFSRNSSIVMGLILVGTGLAMPLVNKKNCQKHCHTAGKNLSMLALGAGSSLIPCPPLVAVFMISAQCGSVSKGVFYGLVYGMGLLVSPLIIAGGGLSFISAAIRQQLGRDMKYVEGLAMLIMVGMGLKMIFV